MKCEDPNCCCISHEINSEDSMSSERADDKCEKCGVKLKDIATDADFEDVIVCSSCVDPDSSNVVEYYNYEPETKSSK